RHADSSFTNGTRVPEAHAVSSGPVAAGHGSGPRGRLGVVERVRRGRTRGAVSPAADRPGAGWFGGLGDRGRSRRACGAPPGGGARADRRMSTSGLLLLRRVQAHRNTTKATEAVPVLYRGAPPDGTYPSLRRLSRTSPGIPSSRPAAAGVPTRQGVPPRGPPPGSGRPGPPRKPRFRN